MDIKNVLDKAYETKSLKELVDAPVSALQGLSEADAQKLKEALGIKTVKDLANNKFFHWAQAIITLAKANK